MIRNSSFNVDILHIKHACIVNKIPIYIHIYELEISSTNCKSIIILFISTCPLFVMKSAGGSHSYCPYFTEFSRIYSISIIAPFLDHKNIEYLLYP